jgi:hypothetical protein
MDREDNSYRPEGRRRLCLNCDNRHGCRSETPVCLASDWEPEEKLLSGKAFMERRGLLPKCRECSLFRQCWSHERYCRKLRQQGP